MLIRRTVCVLLFLLTFSLSFGLQLTEYGLARLGYENGADLFGVYSRAAFYFPEPAVPQDSEVSVRLHYAYTDLAGPKTMVTFLVNGRPVAVRTLPDRTGDILIPLPAVQISTFQGLTIDVLVTLDYSECDHNPLAKESLWFSINPETTFSFSGVPEPPETIAQFFQRAGCVLPLRLVVQEYALSTMKSLSQTSLLLGFLSKGLRKEIAFSSTIPEADPPETGSPDTGDTVLFKPGAGLSLTERSLTVGNDAAELLSSDTLPLLAFRSVENPSIGPESPVSRRITFEELGWSDQAIEVVYTAERTLGFPADLFGGIPQSSLLSLEVSAAHLEEEEAVTLAVFLNDRLVGTVALDSKVFAKTVVLPLPSASFLGYNRLRFEGKKYRGECKSVTLAIQSNSLIRWESVEPLTEARFYDFPYFLYGKTGIVLSSLSEESAAILSALMLKKGEGSYRTTSPELFSLEDMTEQATLFRSCDSYLFLVAEGDIGRVFPNIVIQNGLRLIHPTTGAVLFTPEKGVSYALLFTGQYEGKPALLCAVHGDPALLKNISETQWRRLRQAPGNLALLTEGGEVVSFTVGGALSVGDPAIKTDRKMDWARILWILAVVVVAVLFLISSYRKTSSNR